jgi:hypothetical protein
MSVLNWHNLDLGKLKLSGARRQIKYESSKFSILAEQLVMPFGLNESDKKLTAKFQILENDLVDFFKKVDVWASKKVLGMTYVPLLKEWNGSYFFLATVSKRGGREQIAYFKEENGESEEIGSFGFTFCLQEAKSIKAFLDFRYLWTRDNHFGLSLVVTDIVCCV